MSSESGNEEQLHLPKPQVLSMHEWESQERLLTDIEHQEVPDALRFNEFVYSKHEWDNIPVIVPRYLIYLSKYIRGLAGFCLNSSQ